MHSDKYDLPTDDLALCMNNELHKSTIRTSSILMPPKAEDILC